MLPRRRGIDALLRERLDGARSKRHENDARTRVAEAIDRAGMTAARL